MTQTVTISVNGNAIAVNAGVTLGSVLHTRQAALRSSPALQSPRGLYCGMGVCFECVVNVDGEMTRACITTVHEGMQVEVRR